MMPWHEWCGLVGVAVVLAAFLLLQARRLDGNGYLYQALNAGGAAAIIVSLVVGSFNLSAFLMELGWVAISVYGMLTTHRHGKRSP